MSRKLQISTRAEGVRLRRGVDTPASLPLGGINVYGADPRALREQIESIAAAINASAAEHLSIAKPVLRALVRDALEINDLEDRLFSALLGLVLRRGEIDATLCASVNDAVFRVMVHRNNLPRFVSATKWASDHILRAKALDVPTLERHLFGARRYNTWSSAWHVLARLAYVGLVEYVDKGRVRLTPGLESA